MTVLTVFNSFDIKRLKTSFDVPPLLFSGPLPSFSRTRNNQGGSISGTVKTVINPQPVTACQTCTDRDMYRRRQGAPTIPGKEAYIQHCAGCQGTRVGIAGPPPRSPGGDINRC